MDTAGGQATARESAKDVLWATGLAALISGLHLSSGGIWESVGGADLHGYFVPKYEAVAHAFLAGRLPLWNPTQVCGTPLLGMMQGAALYPPVVLPFSLLEPRPALQVVFAFHWFVLAWGTLAYARSHGIQRAAAAVGVLVTVAAFLAGPLRAGVDHPSFAGGLAWLPVILLCWERAIRDGASPWLAWMAVASAMQWLAGYPDFPLDTAPLLAMLALVSRDGTFVRRIGLAIAGLALGALLASVQLVPVVETILESFRADTDFSEIRSVFSMNSLVALHVVLVEQMGLATLILAAIGVGARRRRILPWLVGWAYCILATTSPFDLLYQLPFYSAIRLPIGWLHLAPLFLGLLVAAGAGWIAQNARGAGRLFAIVWLVGFGAIKAHQIWDLPQQLQAHAPDYALAAERAETLRDLQAEQRDASGRGPRLVSFREAVAGSDLRFGIHSAAGGEPALAPRRISRLVGHVVALHSLRLRAVVQPGATHELLSLLGIGLVVTPSSGDSALAQLGFEVIAELPPDDLVLYKPALPRARIVHEIVRARDEEDSFALTVSPTRNFAREAVVVAQATMPPVFPADPRARESAYVVHDEPERVVIDVSLATSGLLVLTDTAFPGWQAHVDGERVAIWTTDYAFRGVHVPGGEHRVTFDYRPNSLLWGAALSAIGIGISGLLLRSRKPGIR